MNPLVSVVIPTFNGAQFLAATVDSVLSQGYSPMEVVVCDDGSTDETAAVLGTFAGRVRVVQQENRGPAAARNRAAAAASGPLLAFLDHDDLWERGKLAVQVRQLQRHPEYGLVYADSMIIDAAGQVHGRRGVQLRCAEGQVFSRLLRGNFIPIETLVMPAAVFREVGGFDEHLQYVEDWDLCLRVAQRHPVGFLPCPLARYRVHDTNLSRQKEPLLVEWGAYLERLADTLRGVDAADLEFLRHESALRFGDAAWQALRRCDFAAGRELARRAGDRMALGRAIRLRTFGLVLRALPGPLARRVGRAFRQRKLLGIPSRRAGFR